MNDSVTSESPYDVTSFPAPSTTYTRNVASYAPSASAANQSCRIVPSQSVAVSEPAVP